MILKLSKILLLGGFLGLMVGCKLQVISPNGGEVRSIASGNCAGGSVCDIDITDPAFSETFTAVPTAGYEFVKWQDGSGFQCADATEPTCSVSLPGGLQGAAIVALYTTASILPVYDYVGIDTDGDGIRDEEDDDIDGDTILNVDDLCPDTPLGTPVDSFGCADADEDGVADTDDLCPNTPAGMTVLANGCEESEVVNVCTDDFGEPCEIQPSCRAYKTVTPSNPSGIYTLDPDAGGTIQPFDAYCDMESDLGGWTLISRFANQDTANWMKDTGEWWYWRTLEAGATTSRDTNADMLSQAFWTVRATEIRISRSDNPTDEGLLVTNGFCLPITNFRDFITSFGNFQNGAVWGNNSVAGTCAAVMGNNYASTNGFQQATCMGDIGAPDSISFWADWSSGNASVMMIGGGGSACSRAAHGIGVTEANAGSFIFPITAEDDFGSAGSDANSNDPYSLNLWVR